MERKQMKNAFDSFNPTQDQVEGMWERLNTEKPMEIQKKKKNPRRGMHYAAAAVIGILVVSLSGLGMSAGASEKLMSMIKEAIGINEPHQDIVGQTVDIQNHGTEIYASDIIYIDEKWLVFGNLRGILLYDLQKEELMGTIDTQAIDCMYFNSDTKQTHVLKQKDQLIIFNSDKGVPFGDYYQFDFDKANGKELSPSSTGNNQKQLNSYYEEWKKEDNRYVDTFREFESEGSLEKYLDSKEPGMYSERSLKWQDQSGTKFISYLVVAENKYILNSYQVDSSSIVTKTLNFGELTEEDNSSSLPAFIYTGEDLAVKAICEYLQEQNKTWVNDDEVWIPNFVIHKQVKMGSRQLVFGEFWSSSYRQNGIILENVGGGNMPACFYLKKNGDHFEVASVNTARDGSYYADDIKAFCKGDPGLYDKFMEHSDEAKKAACKKYLQMYVKQSGLAVKYYKESGWDPVEIFKD